MKVPLAAALSLVAFALLVGGVTLHSIYATPPLVILGCFLIGMSSALGED